MGGPPALISTANDRSLTYICDQRQIPIAIGSAYHLEWDSPSEAPTSFQPIQFMLDQIYRVIVPETLSYVQKSSLYSWRSLDWMAWLTHPEFWIAGLRLAWQFQVGTMVSDDERSRLLQDCAQRCKANEKFYDQLNKEEQGRLLQAGKKGSIIVARTQGMFLWLVYCCRLVHIAECDLLCFLFLDCFPVVVVSVVPRSDRTSGEVQDLASMKEALSKENRQLVMLTKEDMLTRYGYYPDNALQVAEKPTDRMLDPNFMQLLSERIKSRNGVVIDGVVKCVYVSDPSAGGIIEYTPNDSITGDGSSGGGTGETRFVAFSGLVMSLGAQAVLDERGDAMLDIVAARGVSAMALMYVPCEPSPNESKQVLKVPSALVCGATNHITTIDGPVAVSGLPSKDTEEDAPYNVYLVKITSSACITPNMLDETSTHYDGTAATGLMSAARQTLDARVHLEPLTVWGCNRQMSRYGQSHWFSLSGDGVSSRRQLVNLGACRPAANAASINATGAMGQNGFVHIQLGAGGGGLTQGPAQAPLPVE